MLDASSIESVLPTLCTTKKDMVCGAGSLRQNVVVFQLIQDGNYDNGGSRSMEGGETMFDLGLTKDDLKRILWTFIQGVLGYALAVAVGWVPGDPWDWKAFGVGLLAAGISAVKNGALSDGSALK